MDIKVSELDVAETVNSTDILQIVQDDGTGNKSSKSTTIAGLLGLVSGTMPALTKVTNPDQIDGTAFTTKVSEALSSPLPDTATTTMYSITTPTGVGSGAITIMPVGLGRYVWATGPYAGGAPQQTTIAYFIPESGMGEAALLFFQTEGITTINHGNGLTGNGTDGIPIDIHVMDKEDNLLQSVPKDDTTEGGLYIPPTPIHTITDSFVTGNADDTQPESSGEINGVGYYWKKEITLTDVLVGNPNVMVDAKLDPSVGFPVDDTGVLLSYQMFVTNINVAGVDLPPTADVWMILPIAQTGNMAFPGQAITQIADVKPKFIVTYRN